MIASGRLLALNFLVLADLFPFAADLLPLAVDALLLSGKRKNSLSLLIVRVTWFESRHSPSPGTLFWRQEHYGDFPTDGYLTRQHASLPWKIATGNFR